MPVRYQAGRSWARKRPRLRTKRTDNWMGRIWRDGSIGPERKKVGRHEDPRGTRSEEHTSELQSPCNLVCRLLLEKKKNIRRNHQSMTADKDGVWGHLFVGVLLAIEHLQHMAGEAAIYSGYRVVIHDGVRRKPEVT